MRKISSTDFAPTFGGGGGRGRGVWYLKRKHHKRGKDLTIIDPPRSRWKGAISQKYVRQRSPNPPTHAETPGGENPLKWGVLGYHAVVERLSSVGGHNVAAFSYIAGLAGEKKRRLAVTVKEKGKGRT